MANLDIFREMETFTREMDDIRGIGLGRLLDPAALQVSGRYPRINLRADEENYYVEALLPGVDPKALEMTVLRGTLTIAGERQAPRAEGCTWHRRERNTGKFLRSVDIPAEIDCDKVQADFKDGVLTVTLPKAESERPKRITIKAG